LIGLFYLGTFAAAMLCAAIYIHMWHKHFDVNFNMIFTLVTIACLGYMLYGIAGGLEGSVRAIQIVYIGGCFLQLFILLSIFNLCRINLPRWVRTLLFAVCGILYASVLTIGMKDPVYGGLFYRNISYDTSSGTPVMRREYGPMHTVFYVMLCLFFIAGIVAVIYSLRRKKQVPRTILYLLLLPDTICILSFFIGRRITKEVDFVPLGYVLAEITFLLIAHRVNLYDISDTVIDSMVRDREIGYLSLDFRNRYLGSNEMAKQLMPGLSEIPVDARFEKQPSQQQITEWLDTFRQNEEKNSFVYTVHGESGLEEDDRIYNVNVNYLYDGNRRRGYIVTLTDDTSNRKYIRLLDTYNENLKQEVGEKTRHIVEMHDNLIMSLAVMVESRDNSTGGHIRRTSEGVRILVDEINREGTLPLDEEFCRDVIKAAPMHDLGKIAVDDAVLRKPGRFTDEEYEKMKRHPAEGARVIHEILLQTDDESFKQVAENVAHYHHERWDGRGYPEGLKEEEIPIEARIMAVADVYDALVSKRVYKEAFDFERADRIILEGMGTQFDPELQSVYVNARPRLEAYYAQLPEN